MNPSLPIVQTNSFKKAAQQLTKTQKKALDNMVSLIAEEAALDSKEDAKDNAIEIDDIDSGKVFKFKRLQQFTLLVYQVDNGQLILTQLMLGAHDNFYRNIKWNFAVRGKLVSLFFAWGSMFSLKVLQE